MIKDNWNFILLMLQFLPFAAVNKYGHAGFWVIFIIMLITTVTITLSLYFEDITTDNNKLLIDRFYFTIYGLIVNLFIFLLT